MGSPPGQHSKGEVCSLHPSNCHSFLLSPGGGGETVRGFSFWALFFFSVRLSFFGASLSRFTPAICQHLSTRGCGGCWGGGCLCLLACHLLPCRQGGVGRHTGAETRVQPPLGGLPLGPNPFWSEGTAGPDMVWEKEFPQWRFERISLEFGWSTCPPCAPTVSPHAPPPHTHSHPLLQTCQAPVRGIWRQEPAEGKPEIS